MIQKFEEAKQKWKFCALSGQPLFIPSISSSTPEIISTTTSSSNPDGKLEQQEEENTSKTEEKNSKVEEKSVGNCIVACRLGNLYNRESVLEYLLGLGQFKSRKDELKKNGFGHIKKIKDVFVIHPIPKPHETNASSSKQATVADLEQDKDAPLFYCPITGLETNGRNLFYALVPCGHVFAEKVFTLQKDSASATPTYTCFTCGIPYNPEYDLIPLCVIDDNKKKELEKKLKSYEQSISEKNSSSSTEKKSKKEKKKKRKEPEECVENGSITTTTNSPSPKKQKT